MSSRAYNFKDSLVIDNGKYLRWLDTTGTSRSNILALDQSNNVKINSAFGDLLVNSNNSGSTTYINLGNSHNVVVATKLGVGFTSANSVTSTITLPSQGALGVDVSNSFMDVLGGSSHTSGSKLRLWGNEAPPQFAGGLYLYAGANTSGSIKLHVNEDNAVVTVHADGATSFSPDGLTTCLSVSDSLTQVTNPLYVSNTTPTTGWSTGAAVISGGLGIGGDVYINGALQFGATGASSSPSTGALVIGGGIGINGSENATSSSSGGSLTVAGGVAIARDTYIGGKIVVLDTRPSTSSDSGSVVVSGGMGVNGVIHARASSPQVKLAPLVNGQESSIFFSSTNTYSAGWHVGHIGSGNWGVYSGSASQPAVTAKTDGNVEIGCTSDVLGIGTGGSLTVLGGASFSKDVLVGGLLTSVSDRRLKTDITPLSGVLSKIDSIEAVRFRYISDVTQRQHIGFIAQDFMKDFPELVFQATPDGMCSLDYMKVTAVLMECIKELKREIEHLKASVV